VDLSPGVLRKREEGERDEGREERGEGCVRLNLSLLGQDGLVLCSDVGGDFYGGGAVGLADEFDFFRGCCAWREGRVLVLCLVGGMEGGFWNGRGGGCGSSLMGEGARAWVLWMRGVLKGLVSRMENSPERGGAMKRGMVDGLWGMRGFDCWSWMGKAS